MDHVKLILFISLIYNFPIFTFGQERLISIEGYVTSNNEAVIGATVQILGTEAGAVVGPQGHFLFQHRTREQKLMIEIRSIGYKTLQQEVSLENEGSLKLNIALEKNNLGLDEVVITGTMKPTFVKASPIKVNVITSEYLNTFMPAASSSIIEGVKLMNGIQEVVACGVCFTNSISINGLPGPYTAILMDGTPMYGNLAAVYGLNGIPNMIIDRFEVIKGPSSTLYGSEAVAGVINIITKDPKEQPELSVDLMATSHLESFGNISTAQSIGKSHGFLGVNYAYMNKFEDRNEDGFGDMINMDRYSIFTKWDIHRKSNKTFDIAAKYYFEDRRNGVEQFLKNRNYRELRGSDRLYGESIYTHRGELFGKYVVPSKESLRLDYSLSHHRQDSYYGADHYEAQQSIAFTNFIWDKELNNHSVLAGLTMRYQSYDDNTVATDHPDHQFIPGIFVQDEWTFSDRFTLLTGSRVDHYEQHGTIFSPRLNVKYKPWKWSTIRANLGTGFRIVNLFTEDHAFITGQRTVEITEKIKPERSYNGSLNFNQLYTIGNSQGTIDIDVYYTYFTNKIIPDYSDPNTISYSNTNGHAITKGIGTNITHEFIFPLSINLGINLQEVTQTEEDEQGKFKTIDVEFASDWSSVFTANYEWTSAKVSFAYTMRWTGAMKLPEVYDLNKDGNPQTTPRPLMSRPFSFHDLQVSKQFSKQWNIYGGIQNIFDYVQPYSPLVGYNDPNYPTGFSTYFDTSYAFAPIHGREFYIGVKWNLK